MSDFLQSIIDRDPAAKSKLSLILTYPGVKAVFFHRVANFFQIVLPVQLTYLRPNKSAYFLPSGRPR